MINRKDILRIGTLSLDIKWADKKANIATICEQLALYGRQIDFLVLPELFSTGFIQDLDVLQEVAEGDSGTTVCQLKELAVKYGIGISGSYLSKNGDSIFNRGFLITPEKEALFYNKRHLFGPSAESELMTAGNKLPPILNYCGWRICLVVCYDLRFPAWCRCGESESMYDLLLVVANWPYSREYAWTHLLIARAIENQAAVIGVNRSGHDDYGRYDNMTHAYDSFGMPIHEAKFGDFSIFSVVKEDIDGFRDKWPILRDADGFTIHL